MNIRDELERDHAAVARVVTDAFGDIVERFWPQLVAKLGLVKRPS